MYPNHLTLLYLVGFLKIEDHAVEEGQRHLRTAFGGRQQGGGAWGGTGQQAPRDGGAQGIQVLEGKIYEHIVNAEEGAGGAEIVGILQPKKNKRSRIRMKFYRVYSLIRL